MKAKFVYEAMNENILLLEKEELKWSKTAADSIYEKYLEVRDKLKEKKNLFSSAKKLNDFLKTLGPKSNGFIRINYPGAEPLYDKFNIKLGYLIMSLFKEMRADKTEKSEEHLKAVGKILSNVISAKSFSEVEKYLQTEDSLLLRFIYDKQNLLGTKRVIEGSMAEGLLTLNLAYKIEDIKGVIKHELQHNTQQKNKVYLGIGQNCVKNKDVLKDLTLENFHKIINEGGKTGRNITFGGGKTKTGLSQNDSKGNSMSKENKDRYFGDDQEYQTWLSGKTDEIIKKRSKEIKGKSMDDSVKILTNLLLKDKDIQKIKNQRKETAKDIMNLLRKKLEK